MKKGKILHELKHHIPFTALASAIAVLLVAIVMIFYKETLFSNSGGIFEIFHPLHVIFSAFVTSALFYKYKKKILSALLIGILGAIIIGSISDIILPWLEANILMLETSFHLPIIESPLIIFGAALIGSILGLFLMNTKFPHFLHVFLSVFASLFYIMAFSTNLTLVYLIAIFFIVFIAVIVPCCLSDIIFPLLFVNKE